MFTAWEVEKEKSFEGCYISNAFTLTRIYPAETVTSIFLTAGRGRMLLHVK